MMLVDISHTSMECVIEGGERDTEIVGCYCRNRHSEQTMFRWSDIEDFPSTHPIVLTGCAKLHLYLTPPHPVPLPDLVIKNMKEVVIILSKDMPHPNLTITNIPTVKFLPGGKEGDTQNMLTYLVITLGVVIIIILVVFTVAILKTRLYKPSCDMKKVSRAQSWRYESSLYVNPSNRTQAPYVPPPPFLGYVQNSSRQDSVKEVDIVRSTMDTYKENTYPGTPPAYREPVDCIGGRGGHTASYRDT